MALNETRLRNAAKNGYPDFYVEWRTQGQPTTDADLLSSSFDHYKDPNTGKATTSKKGNGSVGGGNGAPDLGTAPSNDAGWLRTALQTQYGMGREGDFKEREFKTLDSVASIFLNNENKFKSMGEIISGFAQDMGMELILHMTQQNELLTDMNTKTGMLGKLSEGFRDEITKSEAPALKLGISFKELSDSVIEMVANSGRFKLLSSETMNEMALASKFTEGMKDMAKMGADFEKAGIGVKDMATTIEKMGLRSMVLGLNARTTTKLIDENLKNLNSYGFKGGVEGLNRMAQKSIEFRMNMEAVTKVADKVWDPENALSMVANLQVMGGAFGALNDPIKMMYMATNDMEGLQDAIIGASKSLVVYNQEQGRFQVTGANLRRAKAMADEFGMSMEQLTTTAVAAMERSKAASDLMGRGFNIKDEDKEFLTNLSQMKGGKMVIEVPEILRTQLGNQVELENMTQQQYDILMEQRDILAKKDMEAVAREQVSLIENINRDLSYIVALMRVQAGRTGNAVAELMQTKRAQWKPEYMSAEASKMAEIFGTGIKNFDPLNVIKASHKLTATAGATTANVSNANTGTEKTKEEPKEMITRNYSELKITSGDVVYDELTRKLTMHELLNRDPRSFTVAPVKQ